MLRVKTYLSPSLIHGIGVYAADDILPGALIWSFEENFDRRFTAEEFQKLSPAILDYYQTYGYQSRIDHHHYLPFDNDRFMNHSDFPNVRCDTQGNFIATAFIAKGEELTCDYREFDEDWDQYSALMSPGVLSNTLSKTLAGPGLAQALRYDSRPAKSAKPERLINS